MEQIVSACAKVTIFREHLVKVVSLPSSCGCLRIELRLSGLNVNAFKWLVILLSCLFFKQTFIYSVLMCIYALMDLLIKLRSSSLAASMLTYWTIYWAFNIILNINFKKGLERCIMGKAHWLVFWRSLVQYPKLMWWLVTTYNSSYRRYDTCFWHQYVLHTCGVGAQITWRSNTQTHKIKVE